MKWINNNRKLIVCWIIIILLAPFFVELLLFAQIMGAEVTLGFLALLYNEYKANYQLRKYQVKQFALLIVRTVQQHPVCQINIYCFHTVSSAMLFVVMGSLTYAILAWYPLIVCSNAVCDRPLIS